MGSPRDVLIFVHKYYLYTKPKIPCANFQIRTQNMLVKVKVVKLPTAPKA